MSESPPIHVHIESAFGLLHTRPSKIRGVHSAFLFFLFFLFLSVLNSMQQYDGGEGICISKLDNGWELEGGRFCDTIDKRINKDVRGFFCYFQMTIWVASWSCECGEHAFSIVSSDAGKCGVQDRATPLNKLIVRASAENVG